MSIIVILIISLGRISLPNDTPVENGVIITFPQTTSMGTIYDYNAIPLLFGDDNNIEDVSSTLGTESITSISNLLGVSPEFTANSPFYIRGAASEVLYGINQNGFSSKKILNFKKNIGGDVQLTLNSKLQTEIYKILANHPEFFKNEVAGSVVVMNYTTGDITSLVSYPSFTLTDEASYKININSGINLQSNNSSATLRPTQVTYPPASLMKPVIYAIALSENTNLKDINYTCSGKHSAFTCEVAHGTMSLTSALAKSCNCFTENLGHHIDNLNSHLENLGFTFKDELSGKSFPKRQFGYWEGKISDTENQNKYTLIGEGSCRTSVLHIAQLYSAIFNNGIMTAPRLIHATSMYHNDPLIKTEASPQKRVFSQEACSLVLSGMREAVTNGTAKTLSSCNLDIAAKTGTSTGNKVAWTVAGVPDINLLVVVCLENTTASGGKTAAPIAAEIIDLLEEMEK